MRDASAFLREAARIYDGNPRLRLQAETSAWRHGFGSGAEWMRLAMAEIRGEPLPQMREGFAWLGCAKYTLAGVAALSALVLSWYCHPLFMVLVVPAFYSVEVQWVFLFPVRLDGSPCPWTESRRLMRRQAGTLTAMSLVLPFAWRMLTGGFQGHGFVRSWCTGCLAVVLWYERSRHPLIVTEEPGHVPRLDVGQRAPLFIRHESIKLQVPEPIRLLLVTDLHARMNCERLCAAVVESITTTRPHLIILGGDLADTQGGLSQLTNQVKAWTNDAPVLAIPGNHDHWLGTEMVRAAMLQAGAHWLPDAPYLHREGEAGGMWLADVDQWTTPPPGTTAVAVLHDPAGFPKAAALGAHLALAGHLHGCQMVLAERRGRLLPGAWFYRWNLLRKDDAAATLIVSRGCADTLPLRWNCPREVVVCDLQPAGPL